MLLCMDPRIYGLLVSRELNDEKSISEGLECVGQEKMGMKARSMSGIMSSRTPRGCNEFLLAIPLVVVSCRIPFVVL